MIKVRNKQELIDLIAERIKKYGNECDLNDIDVSKITDMSSLFNGSDFNGDISRWDTSNVEDMSYMFSNAHKFNQPIGSWDTSNVTDMDEMFKGVNLSSNLKPSRAI